MSATDRPTTRGSLAFSAVALSRRKARPTAAPEDDGAKLPDRRCRQEERERRRGDRERRSIPVGRERARHLQHGQRDDRDGRDLQAVQSARARGVTEPADAEAEEEKQDRRGRGEGGPGGERAEIACPRKPDGDADLARGRAGEELAKRHEIRVSRLVEPAPALPELGSQIAEMSDRAAKGGEPELEKGEEHLSGTRRGFFVPRGLQADITCSTPCNQPPVHREASSR